MDSLSDVQFVTGFSMGILLYNEDKPTMFHIQ